jgi:serine protease Do
MQTLTRWLAILVLAWTWTGPAAAARAADDETRDKEIALLARTGAAFTAIAKAAVPAVVFIQVEKEVDVPGGYSFNDPFELFGDEFMRRFFGQRPPPQGTPGPRRRFRQRGQGSGFLISTNGYILTNNHVVGDADKITVRLSDGSEYEGKRIGSDAKSEVAVIKIDPKAGQTFACLAMGDSSDLEIGEWVLAIGNPFGLAETVTAGIVSAKGRSNIGIADYENFIQTDAAINPGNSGGPLLNLKGEVIGINTAIYSQSGGYMGIGFAIPINMAVAIKEQLVASGKVSRGYIGIYMQPMTAELAESFGLKESRGILVSDTTEESAAAEAGIRQGDVIVKLNGEDVTDMGAFRNAIAGQPPGTEFKLTVMRDGKPEDIKVTSRALPDDDTAEAEADSNAGALLEKLGLQVQDLTEAIAKQLGYDEAKGVVVTSVDPNGPAAAAGMRPGILIDSVNREKVESVKAFQDALGAADKTKAVLLRVREGSAYRFVALRIE